VGFGWGKAIHADAPIASTAAAMESAMPTERCWATRLKASDATTPESCSASDWTESAVARCVASTELWMR